MSAASPWRDLNAVLQSVIRDIRSSGSFLLHESIAYALASQGVHCSNAQLLQACPAIGYIIALNTQVWAEERRRVSNCCPG